MKAVNGRAEVYMDSGVRCGTDALKALALGARAVFIGRPVFWGLGIGVCMTSNHHSELSRIVLLGFYIV